MRRLGIVREADGTWRSETSDPQFLVSFRVLRPLHYLFFLEPLDGTLDPILYLDRGRGLDESDIVPLELARPTVYVIGLKDSRDVARLRFDPASRPARFRFWAKPIYREASLPRLLAKLTSGAAAIPLDVTLVTLPSRPRFNRPKVAGSIRQFIRHAASRAAMEAPVTLGASSPLDKDVDPAISLVVPTFNTQPRLLRDLVASVFAPPSVNVELVFSDDGSTSEATLASLREFGNSAGITYIPHSRNTGIAAATNRGILAARGRWIGLVDHDDAIVPHALTRVLAAIGAMPGAKFFYTDEIVTDEKLRPIGHLLKPAFDPVLLSGVNYINHLSLYRRDRIRQLGGLREGFEGSQDYDLLLRYLDGLSLDEVVHIPYPAYLWRRGPSTYSEKHRDLAIKSARLALSEHYGVAGRKVPIEPALEQTLHRPRFDTQIVSWPPVTVVIPSRNGFDMIERVLRELREITDYPDMDIVVIDNGSTDARVHALYARYQADMPKFRVFVNSEPFNFARQVNRGIQMAGGRNVLLLNNDIEILSNSWLKEMVSCLAYAGAGIVGAKLLYPNGTIQHAGVIVGLGGLAGHWYERRASTHPGPFGRLYVRQSVSAVTGACMLISRACIEQVGLFDESAFPIAYNDVDYCLRAASKGFRAIWTPFATLTHYESASRGSDDVPEQRDRFAGEKAALRDRHRTAEYEDRAFSPWYTRDRSEPGLLLLDVLPEPRSGSLAPRYGGGEEVGSTPGKDSRSSV